MIHEAQYLEQPRCPHQLLDIAVVLACIAVVLACRQLDIPVVLAGSIFYARTRVSQNAIANKYILAVADGS